MNSKMNIKSIFIMAVISIISMLFINISLAANTGTINVDVANLRETADANSKILEQIPSKQEVEIMGEQGDWYNVSYKNMTGYISKELVTVNSDSKTTEEKNNVNENSTNENTTSEDEKKVTENANAEIKLEEYKILENTKLKLIPSINATDVLELKKDENVKVTEVMNGWVCVETQTTKGWIRKDKLKSLEEIKKEQEEQAKAEQEKVQAEQAKQEEIKKAAEQNTPKTQYVSSTTVNVRRKADSTSEIITTIALNTEVKVYSTENGWSKIKVNNVEGYVSASLLSNNKKETSRGETVSRKSSSTSTNKTSNNTVQEITTTVPASSNGSGIVSTAKQYIGCKYVYGGMSPTTGFDCSGFTSYVFKLHGVGLSRTAQGQYSNGTSVSRSDLQPGDLVMFGSSASSINHVGIYIGGGQIIHAANPSKGVTTDSITSGYYNNKYVGARRVM